MYQYFKCPKTLWNICNFCSWITARKKKQSDEVEDKKADKDLDAKLEAASQAYEEWLSFVEEREEEERRVLYFIKPDSGTTFYQPLLI